MSDAEDDGVPDSLTAQKLCKEFEHITNTDEIMAQMFLQVHTTIIDTLFGVKGTWFEAFSFQDNAWDLTKALNNFFAKKCEKIEAEKVEEILEANIIGEEDKVSVEAALESGVLTTQVSSHVCKEF